MADIKELEEQANVLRMKICGIHSGFPECCIEFFVNHWLKKGGGYDEEHRKFMEANHVSVGYVPCPECIKNKTFIKKINRCTCGASFNYGRVIGPNEKIEITSSQNYETNEFGLIKDQHYFKHEFKLTDSKTGEFFQYIEYKKR